MTNGHATQPVAVIQIALMPDGTQQAQISGANPLMAIGMMELAKATVLKQLGQKPAIELAPPGMSVPRQ